MNDRGSSVRVKRNMTGLLAEGRRSWTRPAVSRLEAGSAENFAANQSDGVSTQS